jgi:hypothetical protein
LEFENSGAFAAANPARPEDAKDWFQNAGNDNERPGAPLLGRFVLGETK